jgi:hypothetical protein
MTYGGQGTLKYGVHGADHGAIYSSRREGPQILPGEGLSKEPIRVDVISSSDKLDPLSRINYTKLYTIEHNVKVFFFGRVAPRYEQTLVDAYNETHQPLPNRPYQPTELIDDTFQHAEGEEPNYPQAMGVYSSSWAGDTGTELPAAAHDNPQDQYQSSWTGQSSMVPPTDHDNPQYQYQSSWTRDTGTEPPAAG